MTPGVVLHFVSMLSASAAAILWLKSSMIRTSPLGASQVRAAGQEILLVTNDSDPVALNDLEGTLSTIAETLRHQIRWTAVGARFAAFAIFLELLRSVL